MTFIPPQNNVCFVAVSANAFDFVVASAYTNALTPEQANVTNGKVYTYYAQNPDGSQWEAGSGAYVVATHTLKRTNIVANSDDTLLPVAFLIAPVIMVFDSSSAVLEPISDYVKYDVLMSLPATQQQLTRSNVGLATSKNIFRNGMFEIWQRGTTLPGYFSGAFFYAADGWMVNGTGTTPGCTINKVSNPRSGAQSLSAMQIVGNPAITNAQVKQRVESTFLPMINGKNVTVQGQITNNTGGTITPTLTVNRGAVADGWGSTTVELAATNLQSCPNGVTTLVAYTFALSSSSNTSGIELIFNFGNNFSTVGKSVTLAEFSLQGSPDLPVGLCAIPPALNIFRYDEEYLFCLRYYMTFTGSNWSSNGVAGQAHVMTYNFPVPMRVSPAMTSTGSASVSNCSFTTFSAGSPLVFAIVVTVTGTGGFQITLNSGSAALIASAEL